MGSGSGSGLGSGLGLGSGSGLGSGLGSRSGRDRGRVNPDRGGGSFYKNCGEAANTTFRTF